MTENMDLFDLTFVISALIFHATIIGIYIAEKNGRARLVRALGSLTVLLGVPLATVLIHFIFSASESWKLLLLGIILLYLLVELVLDFVLKIEFRKKPLPHGLYIILFYAAVLGFISISFTIHPAWGYAVSISFWVLLAALIYNLVGRQKGRPQVR